MAFNGDYGVSLIGGDALLNGVRITGQDDKGTGVYATGMGEVMMKEVKISEVQTGVWVKNGNLMMHKGSVAFNGGHGIYLTRGNALLKGVRITGQGHSAEVAVKALTGTVVIKGVDISKVTTGVEVGSGANATLIGGEIGFMGDYGVYLNQGGAALKNVRMTYTGNNKTAEFIKVKGGIVIAEGVNIISTTDNGQGISV
ncbi:right-handed parallel beta-helix repeat-containing protein, partial [Bartonella bovis]|uniref:right-handed parallel beta-helix repeat-containing protein n=1 Tax=Bartonella bovis TaxID=155194 RepID=UPI0011AFA469